MKLFKNYKKLYLNELENRKKLIGQCSNLSKENVDYQKEIKCYKEKCGQLTIDLEDTQGFLAQETIAKKELIKQRANLKREIARLKKELNKDGE